MPSYLQKDTFHDYTTRFSTLAKTICKEPLARQRTFCPLFSILVFSALQGATQISPPLHRPPRPPWETSLPRISAALAVRPRSFDIHSAILDKSSSCSRLRTVPASGWGVCPLLYVLPFRLAQSRTRTSEEAMCCCY